MGENKNRQGIRDKSFSVSVCIFYNMHNFTQVVN
jgi:hypothetical protein